MILNQKNLSNIFIVILVLSAIYYLRAILLPFFMGALGAYLMYPLVKFLKRKVNKNGLAVFLSFVIVLGVFIGVFCLIRPSVSEEFKNAKELLSQHGNKYDNSNNIPDLFKDFFKKMSENEEVKKSITGENGVKILRAVLPGFWAGITNVMGILLGLFGIVTFFLYFIFILLDYESLSKNWKSILPPKARDNIIYLVNDVEKGMQAYFKAQGKIVVCIAILFAIGFKIIGLPLGILFGIFVGLLNFVPYLQNAAIIPAAFLASLSALDNGNSFWYEMSLVLVVFGVVQLIQDAFLTPKIMGDLTGMNAAVILLSLSIWGSFFGLVGMIIALPLTTITFSYYKRFVLNKS